MLQSQKFSRIFPNFPLFDSKFDTKANHKYLHIIRFTPVSSAIQTHSPKSRVSCADPFAGQIKTDSIQRPVHAKSLCKPLQRFAWIRTGHSPAPEQMRAAWAHAKPKRHNTVRVCQNNSNAAVRSTHRYVGPLTSSVGGWENALHIFHRFRCVHLLSCRWIVLSAERLMRFVCVVR